MSREDVFAVVFVIWLVLVTAMEVFNFTTLFRTNAVAGINTIRTQEFITQARTRLEQLEIRDRAIVQHLNKTKTEQTKKGK